MGTVELLLVEDSPTDALLTAEAFVESSLRPQIHRVDDGDQALAFLRREGSFAASPRPGLILLDLNLPRKNGFEVLREIKTDESLRVIPVVVLTASRDVADVGRSYGLHANCYIAKPVNFERFDDVVRAIEEFWFKVVVLPA